MPGLLYDGVFTEYSDLSVDAFNLCSKFLVGSKIYLKNPNPLELLTVIVSLGSHVSEITIIPEELNFPENRNKFDYFFVENEFQLVYIDRFQKPQYVKPANKAADAMTAQIRIYSSGTSGVPKVTCHSLSGLFHQFDYQKESEKIFIWGLLYQTSRMAALQVLLNSYLRGESIICLSNQTSLKDRISIFKSHHVNALSGTPSMFRYLIQDSNFCGLSLKQITLGGEIVNQEILNSLSFHFPQSKLTHIYASTELGFGFAVSDGLSGFPKHFLHRNFGRFRLETRENELVFVLFDGLESRVSESLMSGDVIREEGDRVYFVGRKTGVVNIGGLKVFPEEVEQVMKQVSGVVDVYVYPVKSSQVGELLMAKVVCDQPITPAQIRSELKQLLPAYKVPASVEIVTELPIGTNGKVMRG